MPFSFTFRLPVPSNPFSNAVEAAQAPPRTSEASHFSDRRLGNQPGMHKTTHRRPSPVLNHSGTALSRKRGWEPAFAEPSRSTATLTSTSGYLDTPAKYTQMAGNQADGYHEAEMMDSDTGVCSAFASDFAPSHLAICARPQTTCTVIYNRTRSYVVPKPHSFVLYLPFLSSLFTPFFRKISLMSTRLILLLHVEMPPPAKRRRGLAGTIVTTALNAALIGTAVGLTVYRLYVAERPDSSHPS